jgi:two-component system chemotaxis response regulator CheB
MARRDVVVIGGSAGALESVSEIVRGRPAGFPAALFVVVHSPRSVTSALPRILSRAGHRPAIDPLFRSAAHHSGGRVVEPDLGS